VPESGPSTSDHGDSARHLSDHLANERTHLAWLRTALSVSGLGIAINRFSLYLSELGIDDRTGTLSALRHPKRVGIVLAILGPIVMLWSAFRYSYVQRAIQKKQYVPAVLQIWLFTAVLAVLTALCATWLAPP
jgi:putative membrane protein